MTEVAGVVFSFSDGNQEFTDFGQFTDNTAAGNVNEFIGFRRRIRAESPPTNSFTLNCAVDGPTTPQRLKLIDKLDLNSKNREKNFSMVVILPMEIRTYAGVECTSGYAITQQAEQVGTFDLAFRYTNVEITPNL